MEKEPWSYEEFVRLYNEEADRYGRWHYILESEEEKKTLERHYNLIPIKYCKTVKEYALGVFSGEQGEGADDIPLKYRK